MKCEICISPAETHAVNLIEWYFNSSDRNSVFKDIEDMDHVNLPNNEDVIIYNLKVWTHKFNFRVLNRKNEIVMKIVLLARASRNVLVQDGRYYGINILFTHR